MKSKYIVFIFIILMIIGIIFVSGIIGEQPSPEPPSSNTENTTTTTTTTTTPTNTTSIITTNTTTTTTTNTTTTTTTTKPKPQSTGPYVGAELSWASFEMFKFGQETYGSDPVANAKREIDVLEDLGANLVRMSIETETWQGNVEKYDDVINYAREKGFTLNIHLLPEPGKVVPLSEYDDFILEFTQRYKPAFLEVYSEPFNPCSDTPWQRISEIRNDCGRSYSQFSFSEEKWINAITNIVGQVHEVSPETKVGAQTNAGKHSCDAEGNCICTEDNPECFFFSKYANEEKSPYDWIGLEPINRPEIGQQFRMAELYWDGKLPLWIIGLDPGASGATVDHDEERSESILQAYVQAGQSGFQGFALFCVHDHGFFWGERGDRYCGILERDLSPKESYFTFEQLIKATFPQ